MDIHLVRITLAHSILGLTENKNSDMFIHLIHACILVLK